MQLSIVWAPIVIVGVLIIEFYWKLALQECGFEYPKELSVASNLSDNKMKEKWGNLRFLPVCWYAFYEEVLWRLIPWLYAQSRFGKSWLMGFIIVMLWQVVFGYWHGTARNILFQGVAGILYVFIFVVFGGLHNPVLGILASTTAHVVWNLNCDYQIYQKSIAYVFKPSF
ncbi:MAG: hypothetical protein WCW78_02690 [Candidatus Paceibacterota bacterium]|jgi:hypothetical protein